MQHKINERQGTFRLCFFRQFFIASLLLITSFLPACSSSDTPQAELRASITNGQVPLKVSFINSSRNATEFQWDFGDGSTMTTTTAGQIINHEYTEVGVLKVTLTAISNGESPQTSIAEINITVRHGPVRHVKLIPDILELPCSQTQQLSAAAMDAYDNPITEAQITWEMADKKAGTISSDGIFTAGTKAGNFTKGITVIARQNSHSAQTTVPVKINPGPLDQVKLSPEAVELAYGQSQQFIAEAMDAYDNPIPEAQLTWEAVSNLGTITNSGILTVGSEPDVFVNGVTVTAKLGNYSASAKASVTVKANNPIGDNVTHPVTESGTPPVNGTIETVTFPDKNLEVAIRKAIGNPEGPIYSWQLEGLSSLSAQEANISDLTGLEYCRNLGNLKLGINNIKDISPLASLINLNTLFLERNQISDISPLANLNKLTYIQLDRNQISDISPLANLIYLTDLQLQVNQISDLSPLSNLTRLITLIIGYNQISDFSPLGNLTSLTKLKINDNEINNNSLLPLEDSAFLPKMTSLEIGHNDISDVSSLANRINLDYLHLDCSQITDISPLSGLTNLTSLRLFDNEIVDLSPVANLTNLTYISLDQNQIVDISPLANLNNLTRLVIGRNKISDISPLANLTNLTILYIDNNKISDITPLANLNDLNTLQLNINQIRDISPLANLTKLTRLFLDDNRIIDISPLVANTGISDGDGVQLKGNPLSTVSVNDYIPQLEARGVKIEWTSE